MGLGILKFALSGIDLLAWHVIALGYPLIPFWSSVRLVVIIWLVMSQFEGSWLAYQGLVRPVLLVRLRAVIDSFYKLKEERHCKRETFLDVVEKYIKENGSEALEKFIVLEHESKKCIDFKRDTKIIESEGESTAVTMKQPISSAGVLNGTDVVTNVKEMTPPEASMECSCPETPPLKKTQQEWTCDLCKVTTMSEAMLNAHLQGRKHESKLKAQQEWTCDLCKVTTMSEAVLNDHLQGRKHESKLITQQEWTCDLCKVTTMSEEVLNDHLQGRKHESKLKTLKASLIDAKDTGASTLQRQVQHMQSVSAAEVKDMVPPKETAEERCPKTLSLQKAQQDWTCDLCKVTTTSEITLNGHLQGRKHKSKLEITIKASKLGAKDEGSSPSGTGKLNHGNAAEKFVKESGSELKKLTTSKTQAGREACRNSHRDIQVVESEDKNSLVPSKQFAQSVKAVWVPKGTDANAEVKETTLPEASSAEIPSLKEVQQELTAFLKTSKFLTKGTGLPPLATCKPNQGYLVGT